MFVTPCHTFAFWTPPTPHAGAKLHNILETPFLRLDVIYERSFNYRYIWKEEDK